MNGQDLLQQAETCLESRNLPAALASADAAEAAGADADGCSAHRWLAHMLLGNFESAWRESDAIRKRGTPDPHRLWQGEALEGKRVILRCLHGLGDAVQFLRYACRLRAQCASLTVEVPPALLELASMFDGVDHAITWGDRAPVPPPCWDVQLEINELPYLFRTQPRELPVASSYLKLPPDLLRASAPRAHVAASYRVGVVWASGDWNPARSLPFACFRRILATRGCEFWNLQGGPQRSDWQALTPTPALHDAGECAEDLATLAALIAQLDLVITPDTLAAHLAGALGTPAWVLLRHAADWRWQHEVTHSPWYASLELIRQPDPDDWPAVISEVCGRLQSAVAEQRQLQPVAS